MLQVIIPAAKGILMGIGAASVVGSVITFAQKRKRSRAIDLADYEFYSEELECNVDFDDLPRSERSEVLADIMNGDLALPE